MVETKNTYALVTGASSGMGYCYAQQLAAKGYNLLIVANVDEIYAKAQVIRQDYPGIDVVALQMDLSLQTAAASIHNYCFEHGLEIEVLVNNAGVYHDRDILADSEGFTNLILNLHVNTPVMLCYLFGKDMVERGRGYILNVCSVTSRINAQRLGTYASTKSFLAAFTRSLHIELKPKGVFVTNISPGAVDTGLYNISPVLTKILRVFGVVVSPEYLVKRALRGLFKGRSKVSVPFVWNAILTFLVALVPTCLLRLIRRLGWF